jgi:hypothetical protein
MMKTLKGWGALCVSKRDSGFDWSKYAQPGDEIDEEAFDYFLGVLPPKRWEGGYFLVSEPCDFNDQGEETYMGFQERDDGTFYYLGEITVTELESLKKNGGVKQ